MGRLRFSPFLCLVLLPKFKFIDSEFIFVLHWFFFVIYCVFRIDNGSMYVLYCIFRLMAANDVVFLLYWINGVVSCAICTFER